MTSTALALAAPVAIEGISQTLYDRQEKFRKDLQENLPQIMAVLPKNVRAETIASTALAATIDKPQLLDCTALSLFRAVYKGAALGLRLGETCDLVPIKSKGVYKAELWIRVKGVAELAKRAGAIQWARVGYVCEGETFEYEERAEGTHFRHVPTKTPKPDGSNVLHVYAVLILPSGTRIHEVWPMERCQAHKARFAKDTKPGSAWAEHELMMHGKGVLKAALRFAPLSPEVLGAITAGDDVDGQLPAPSDDPTKALQSGGAIDQLEQMDAGEPDDEGGPEAMSLAEAEAMLLPGKKGDPKVWGGKGGLPLGTFKTALLAKIILWVGADAERVEKFAMLSVACEVIMRARSVPDADGVETEEPEEGLAA